MTGNRPVLQIPVPAIFGDFVRHLQVIFIQGGDADVSCTAWLRTTLLGVVIHMCRRHAAPTQAQVRLH